MDDPVLVEVTRGALVESRHRGTVAVVDADGGLVLALGDVEQRVFPRSAVKAIQALPLVETGAADRYGITEEEIALACASHSGEPRHAETAARMLTKLGRDFACLECGAHWPMGAEASQALARSGATPTALHNNCSGKHAGFICVACALDVDPSGYVEPAHAVQREVRAAMEALTGAAHGEDVRGTDGCSIPTYAVPLRALALAFARFGSGRGLAPARAAAAARIRAAVAAHPFMVAGTGRFDTLLMEALGTRAFVKVGAEGVYCASLPELGLGIALKCDDGAGRAAEVVMAALTARFLPLSGEEGAVVESLARPQLNNWNGRHVGGLRPAAALG
ncbi:asparaginase [Chelatococcus sp. SYSU_G07232]|uniref:Asparaginase n=1 Tax=Chelatococcus albus TaxID=3047466 RepID=A0ABT7ALF8_9HYPH|nr:asparaginase [Chelatococcus sp. SYSU_G07232]MDJ1159431.1 asparaginase [Chelatococcus sp. SYSU_G07232]